MNNDDKMIRNFGIFLGTSILAIILWNIVIAPQYNVWAKSLAGKALLSEAEYSRQIAVLEAKAKLDSAKELAQAEVERAKGVSAANKIIGESLKGNPEYLSYLWVTGLEEGAEKGNKTVYMIPSQGNIPAPVFDVTK